MKILQVIDTLEIGGAERMCVNISNLLTSKSIENSILVTRKLGPLSKQVESDKIVLISKKNGLDFLRFYRFIRVIKAKRPDVLHAHSTSIYWTFGAKLIFPEIKLIWHDHDGMSEFLEDSDRKLIKVISKYFHAIIVVNQILYDWNKRNALSKNVYLLRNFSLFRTIREKGNNETIRLVCLANFREQKDHMTLFRALELIPYTVNFECICAGQVSDEVYFQQLKDFCKNNLSHRVKFVGEVEDVEELLISADIGVLSSKSEGLPVALLEYGCAGLAVVVTDVGQCSKVLGDGVFGRIFQKENSRQMAEALTPLINNKEERSQLGNKFKCHVENEYGSDFFYKDYSGIID
jgi:glycosyltransferase involved in cell wall biosynthesis